MTTKLIVFSKDRALQCDSLLRSIETHCTGIDHTVVLACASSQLHIDAYMRLKMEGGYDELTIDGPGGGLPLGQYIDMAIEDAEYVALAVDDMIFYAPSDFALARRALEDTPGFVWSWRLGHRMGVTAKWNGYWAHSSLLTNPDYGYLFHTDGALYRAGDYVRMLDKYLPDWKTGAYIPNDLEAAVAVRQRDWAATASMHLGPLHPTCITWQLNRVQNRFGSPAAEISATSVDALAEAYLAGKRVDNAALYADASWRFRFNPAGARPTHVYASEEASRFYASMIR